MSSLQIENYSLVTGAAATTGSIVNINRTENVTIYYNFSGSSTGSNVNFGVEARDPAGNFGYVLDFINLTGTAQKSISTFSAPISNGVRGYISSIVSGSGYCYIDNSY